MRANPFKDKHGIEKRRARRRGRSVSANVHVKGPDGTHILLVGIPEKFWVLGRNIRYGCIRHGYGLLGMSKDVEREAKVPSRRSVVTKMNVVSEGKSYAGSARDTRCAFDARTSTCRCSFCCTLVNRGNIRVWAFCKRIV
jgi:hypothetical protein